VSGAITSSANSLGVWGEIITCARPSEQRPAAAARISAHAVDHRVERPEWLGLIEWVASQVVDHLIGTEPSHQLQVLREHTPTVSAPGPSCDLHRELAHTTEARG